MPATTLLRDCSALVTAAEEAGGKAPKVLMNILAGAALLNAHSTVPDPARAIVAAATDGTLTAEKLGELVTEAAHAQVVNTYIGELRQRSERMFVAEFRRALGAGACDELLGTLRPIWDEHAAAVGEARARLTPRAAPNTSWIRLDEAGRVLAAAPRTPRRTQPDRYRRKAIRAERRRLFDDQRVCQQRRLSVGRLGDLVRRGGSLEADSAAFRRPGRTPPAPAVRRAVEAQHRG